MTRPALVIALIAALACAASGARAHTSDRIFSSWTVDGNQITATVRLPAFLAARLDNGGDEPERALAGHFLRMLHISIGSGACAPEAPPATRMTPDGVLVVELAWRCAGREADEGKGTLALRADSLFGRLPNLVHFARLRLPGGRMEEWIITNGNRLHRVNLDRGAAPAARSLMEIITEYAELGITHILEGTDHLAFILALMLASISHTGHGLRAMLFVITGFTLGHSLTLALAATGTVTPVPGVVEALIGFTIAAAAVEGASRVSGRAPHIAAVTVPLGALALAAALSGSVLPAVSWVGLLLFTVTYMALLKRVDSRRWTVTLAAAFGLVHGFGFAGVLQEIGLPELRMVPALLGFNLGVELGQAIAVGVVLILAAAAGRLTPAHARPWAAQGLAAALCGLGTFWFVSRAFAG